MPVFELAACRTPIPSPFPLASKADTELTPYRLPPVHGTHTALATALHDRARAPRGPRHVGQLDLSAFPQGPRIALAFSPSPERARLGATQKEHFAPSPQPSSALRESPSAETWPPDRARLGATPKNTPTHLGSPRLMSTTGRSPRGLGARRDPTYTVRRDNRCHSRGRVQYIPYRIR